MLVSSKLVVKISTCFILMGVFGGISIKVPSVKKP